MLCTIGSIFYRAYNYGSLRHGGGIGEIGCGVGMLRDRVCGVKGKMCARASAACL